MSDPVEIAAVIAGVLCVWLTARQHIACWPAGLVQVVLYIGIFYQARLYSDMLLHVIYVFLQLYGWHAWLHGGRDRGGLAVSRLPAAHLYAWSAACLLGTAALGGAMQRFTDASFPFVDAFVTVASLIAQWLIARKVLESWLIWLVVDVVSIGLFWAKALYLTAGLYAVFLCLAAWGWWSWRRSWKNLATA